MKTDIILSNKERTIGFVHVEDFQGDTAAVSLENLKRAIKVLEDFADKGLTPPKISLGIETSRHNNPGMIIFFLDENGKTGIAIAPVYDKGAD